MTELALTLAQTEKRVARAKALKRWGMLSLAVWPLCPLAGVFVGSVCLAGAMVATLALITVSHMAEANAKLAATRAHAPQALPAARLLNR